jgi:transcription-repair coupling factor (superfamily II helicase)
MRDMAEELLKLYAARKAVAGHAFGPDTHWQEEFEGAFPYELTPDQAAAIADIKADMEAPTPMDRLLCGDVGYGKTEVAMRAAFKAVMDGKQVAFLAPTTVLAAQHQKTLRERFAAFPVRIDMVSRFRSKAEQKKALEELAAGGSTSSSARTACCRRTSSSATSACSSWTRSSGSASRTRRRSSSSRRSTC